jgi:gas vesicle structural protein
VTKPLERADERDDQLVLGDLVDHLLNKGVVIQGEVVLSLAGVDLVYLRLQAMLSAADRARGRRKKR